MPARRSSLLVRFIATWLLASAILSVVLGLAIGIPSGLFIALGYAVALSKSDVLRQRRTRELAERTLSYPPR